MHADRVTVVIPARGGSSRIPRKNIRDFNGKPMITWPIEAARSLPIVDRVVVSTDDDEIARVAMSAGAEVPYVRPAELASSTAGTAPVITHAITQLALGDDEWVVCLYPTSTLNSELLASAISQSLESPGEFTIGVFRHRSPLERALKWDDNQRMVFSSPDHLLTRTQDLPERYFDAGKFYGARVGVWTSQPTMMSKPFQPFFLPPWASVDLDEPEDWPIAEALHRAFVRGATG